MEITRKNIILEARSYLGIPWRHQGRTRKGGIDCVGLPALVGIHFNLWDSIPVQYPRRPDGTFAMHFKTYLVPKPMNEIEEADVMIFAEGGHPCHCGIRTNFLGQPGVIHAHAGIRKVMEQTLESARPLMGKPVYAYSFPAVVD